MGMLLLGNIPGSQSDAFKEKGQISQIFLTYCENKLGIGPVEANGERKEAIY
jgi:hypothetical protein